MKLISHIKQLVTLAHLFFLPLAAFAQTNGITISDFKATPGIGDAPTTLTFNIEWSPPQPEIVWSDTVWVFVDYNNKGTMTRLPLDPSAATLTWHSATYCPDCGVDRDRSTADGVWVVGNARTAESGTFSATVQLCRDVARHVSTGMCVYAINYPPVGRYTAGDQIKFNGTPPFYLTFDGAAATVSVRDGLGAYTYPPEGKKLMSLTDASLAPGSVPPCMMPAAQTLTASAQAYCAGSGVTFALSGTDDGATYRLIKEGTESATTLTGTGSPATFTGTFSAGTYRAEIVPGDYCPRTLPSQVTVTEVALPEIPTVQPPATVCAGSVLTFVAEGGSGSYDWTGSVAGEGNNKSTENTAGEYSAAARSLVRYDGTTCYSTYSAPAKSTINSPGNKGQSAACGCASPYVACSGTCNQVANHKQGECAGCHRYWRCTDQCTCEINTAYGNNCLSTCTTTGKFWYIGNNPSCGSCQDYYAYCTYDGYGYYYCNGSSDECTQCTYYN